MRAGAIQNFQRSLIETEDPSQNSAHSLEEMKNLMMSLEVIRASHMTQDEIAL